MSSPSTPPRGALGVIFLIVFLDLMGAGILVPVIPYIVEPYRADALTVGVLAMSFSAAQFVASPFLGLLSDRFGRRPILLLSVLGSAGGYFLFGYGRSLAVLFLARITDGLTGGNISTAQAYIADISAPKDRAKNFGLIGAAFGLGFILGPALGGVLSKISLAAPAYAAGVFSLVTFAVGAVLLKESLPAEHRTSAKTRWHDVNPFSQIRAAFARVGFRELMLATFAMNFGMAGLQTNFAVFTHVRFGLDASHNAILFAFLGLMAALTQGLLLRKLAPSLGEGRLAVGGSLLLGLGFVVLALSNAIWMLYACLVLTALGFGLAGPSLSSLVSHKATPREQGVLLGTMQSVASFTRVVGPVWAGLSFDHLGQGAPYWTGAVCAGLSMMWAIHSMRESL
ncbi:MFS transporter [uncultured Paludibaculum sp.]|uniref:MFS transporter n=1 Tax=uncultured Paludibaculum sp. TaxID=1765020 RepID=UPI002AABD35D|nr:MFS transporter [uncultured Paludibaculum sp.]